MSSIAVIDVQCEKHGVQFDTLANKDSDGRPVAACGTEGCTAAVSRWWGGYNSDVHGSGFAPYEAVDSSGNPIRIDSRDAESDFLKARQAHYDNMVKMGYQGLASKRPDKMYVMTEREAKERHAQLVERNFEHRRANGLPTNNLMREMRIKL